MEKGDESSETLGGIEILTDDYGVSHVYADDTYSLSYANGYVQARDRLFEMDVLRHVGYGDSSSVIGPSQLDSDIHVVRDLYGPEEMDRQFEEATETTREAIRGFADGANRAIREMKKTGLPAEFTALGHEPEEWKPRDTVAIINYLIGFFGVRGGEELDNAKKFAQLRRALGDEREAYEAYGDLNWLRVTDDHTTSIPAEEFTKERGEEVPGYDDVPDEQLEYVEAALDAEVWGVDDERGLAESVVNGLRDGEGLFSGFKWGSNAMVVSGEHTETGNPMTFGAPQMGYLKPPVIHEVGLHGDGFDVAGVGVVGTPGVIIGRTPDFAWSVTSGYDDQVDTLVVELDPEDRHRYRWRGEWREMETRTVEHTPSVRGGIVEGEFGFGNVEQEVARVVVEIDGREVRMPVIAWNEEENVAWCQRTTTRGEELDAVLGWVELGRQDGYEGFVDQLEEFPFTFNFHYADEDDIAFVHTGKVPHRTGDADPRLPVPADLHDWEGTDQGTEMGLCVKNPDQGYVVNWNNAPVGGWSSGDVEQEWGDFHRVDLLDDYTQRKIEETDGSLTLKDVEEIVEYTSIHDAVARYSARFFAEAGFDASDETLRRMAAELEEWGEEEYGWWNIGDGKYHPGHAIWEETRLELQELLFHDLLGEETPELVLDPPSELDPEEKEDPHAGDRGRFIRESTFLHALRGETNYDWFDGDRDATIRRAMRRARDTLTERFGSTNPGNWRMDVRKTSFFALGAAQEDSIDMVNRGTWTHVVALGEGLEGSRGVLPPSNSGHLPLKDLPRTRAGDEPKHLHDQLEMYENFDYKPFAVTREEVEEIATESRSLSDGIEDVPTNTLSTVIELLLGSR